VEITADDDVVLRVTDNGRGLPEERRAGGRGLLNMDARASRLGGTMRAAAAGAGTALEWRVPIASP